MSYGNTYLIDSKACGQNNFQKEVLGYRPLLNPRETQAAIFVLKDYIETRLCRELNLMRVTCPLVVDADTGINDMLSPDGSQAPIHFSIANGDGTVPLQAQVVQAATKWKRTALKTFDMEPGEGLLTDMRALRKDDSMDHDHSVYVDQWDWEQTIRSQDRNLIFLRKTVEIIWKVLKGAEERVCSLFPQFHGFPYPGLPDKLAFVHAEELFERYPDLPPLQRESELLKENPAIFVFGLGWPLEDGAPHEHRAADYDDWSTETRSEGGRIMHGLNGDLVVWNPVTNCRHELMSGGIRVTKESLKKQLVLTGQENLLKMPYHQAVFNHELPLSIGGGIGQSRTHMLLLRKAHIGEVSLSVWSKKLRQDLLLRNVEIL